MQQFTGRKTIKAAPMTLGEYNKLQNWTLPDDQDPETSGYLVEYQDFPTEKKNAIGNFLHLSWSPAHVFEESYKPSGSFTERLIIEHDELLAKLNALSAFLETNTYKNLDEDRRRLLQQQNELMFLYVDTLQRRISLELGSKFPAKEAGDE